MLDVRPPLRHRGAARDRAVELAAESRALGLPLRGQRVGEWVVDPTLRQRAGLPAAELVPELLEGTGLQLADGLVRSPGAGLPARAEKAVCAIEEWVAADPFRAPEANELAELKLGPRELAAAVRAGRLTRIADGVALGSVRWSARPVSSRSCRSRSPSARPAARWAPPGGSRCRCWNGSTPGASPGGAATAPEQSCEFPFSTWEFEAVRG